MSIITYVIDRNLSRMILETRQNQGENDQGAKYRLPI